MLLIAAFLVVSQNFILPNLFKKYINFHAEISVKKATREMSMTPQNIKVEEDAYSLNLSDATGFIDNFNAYAVSPSRYAINSYIARKIKGTSKNSASDQTEIIPQTKNFKTEILVVDSRFVKFKEANVQLRKFSKNSQVNAVLYCSDDNFNRDNNYCQNWEIYDGGYEDKDGYISFSPQHFSVYAGAYLEILNVQSNLTVGENWEVLFNTYGQSDLMIEAYDETKYNVDLQFIKLYCGDEEVSSAFAGDKIFVADYACEGKISRLVNKVLTGGRHNLVSLLATVLPLPKI